MLSESLDASLHRVRRGLFYGLRLSLPVVFLASSAPAQPSEISPTTQQEARRAQSLVGSYEGALAGKYRVRMQLSTQDSVLTGQYYYLRNGQLLRLTGHLAPGGAMALRESAGSDTAATGLFEGRLQPDGKLLGSWHNAAGTVHLLFELARVVGTAPPTIARARIGSKTYFRSFTIPLVTVPDAGVSKLLAECFSLQSLLGETPTSLRAMLEDEKESGLYGPQTLSYTVGYNGHGLLSISTLAERLGAGVWYEQRTQTLDLNTGFPVVLADEIRPELVPAFLALGQQKLQKITRQYVPTQDGFLQPEDVAGVLSQVFSFSSTTEYTVSASGLLFDHPVSYDSLSNFVLKVLKGSFRVAFSHAELARFLKPDSPLRRLK
jgi:hypothetical protein